MSAEVQFFHTFQRNALINQNANRHVEFFFFMSKYLNIRRMGR